MRNLLVIYKEIGFEGLIGILKSKEKNKSSCFSSRVIVTYIILHWLKLMNLKIHRRIYPHSL